MTAEPGSLRISEETLPCRHCSDSGTCSNGDDGNSCAACVNSHGLSHTWFLFKRLQYRGLVCGVCGGVLQAEIKAVRLKRFFPFSFVAVLLMFTVSICFFAMSVDHSMVQQILSAWLALFSATGGAVLDRFILNKDP